MDVLRIFISLFEHSIRQGVFFETHSLENIFRIAFCESTRPLRLSILRV
jgi:hypothetical protein